MRMKLLLKRLEEEKLWRSWNEECEKKEKGMLKRKWMECVKEGRAESVTSRNERFFLFLWVLGEFILLLFTTLEGTVMEERRLFILFFSFYS